MKWTSGKCFALGSWNYISNSSLVLLLFLIGVAKNTPGIHFASQLPEQLLLYIRVLFLSSSLIRVLFLSSSLPRFLASSLSFSLVAAIAKDPQQWRFYMRLIIYIIYPFYYG